jgi:large subunit ribosomal protein L29
MKPMKVKHLRELTPEELKNKLIDARENLFKLNFRKQTRQLPDLASIKIARKDISKLMTVLENKNKSA